MERDSRRNQGQWRGCYNFEDIICDGDAGNAPKRSGGLKMGQTYYYYYEVNGSSEVHDPSLPSTTACPYLPGQPVNTLWIPVEQSLRKRSGSLNSLRSTDFKTMDPAAKYAKLKPAAPIIDTAAPRRLDTAPQRMQQQHKRSARSISPGSGWSFSPRKLFSRKTSSSSLKESQLPPMTADDERATARSEGSRSRDISPESLRRFLVDDAPLEEEQPTALAIPEDIVEENEDDDNFATSAVSETMQYTGLSPPPQRAISPTPTITPATVSSIVPEPTVSSSSSSIPMSRFNNLPKQPSPTVSVPSSNTGVLRSRFTTAPTPSSASEPQSPDSNTVPGFYHSDNDNDDIDAEDEDDEEVGEKQVPVAPLGSALNKSTYSLPKTAGTVDKPLSTFPLLTATIPDSGLVDDLVGELGWMADFITA
ncbi:hypothetical protein B0T21DRAFT_357190 [Apiosordaria backusii]|uniref:Uncharacterized protein n=1 Tax=Apiosordaria backusii TaxID=314023 RepID=A0AA40F0B1_9PEZI|nr:hypothetical protein B0T21DRAFT_357190 [Apiosordaria backusii]